jgi:electron transport complex protein RnfC
MSDLTLSPEAGTGTFPRGIHPEEAKELAEDAAIETLAPPAKLFVPVLQHIGAPAKFVVKPRKDVAVGDPIAEAGGFVSAPIHASVSGKTAKTVNVTLPNGRHIECMPITPAAEQPSQKRVFDDVLGGEWPVKDMPKKTPEEIVEAVKNSGLVGQGGAAFPTFIKLLRNDDKPVDTILINGCECEPYLTADYRVMLEAPRAVLAGAILAAEAAGARQVVVAVEDNKPKAIEELEKHCAGTIASVKTLKTKYPAGGEKQTVRAALGRTVPTGGLPLDVGVVVLNVGTATTIARAVLRGKPLTHRVVTVSGRGITTPKNLLVAIGTPISHLIAACGGLKDSAVRVVAGGPMMGFSVANLETPVTKGTSGITVFEAPDVAKPIETACVRCGRCVDVCPLNLVPTRLALAARAQVWDVAKRYHMMACMECGCCAYTCPASIPLVQLIRMGKALMPKS